MSYRVFPGAVGVEFQDRTRYSLTEMLTLAHTGGTPADFQALHALKRALDGEILPQGSSPHAPANYRRKKTRIDRAPGPRKPRKKQDRDLSVLNSRPDAEQLTMWADDSSR